MPSPLRTFFRQDAGFPDGDQDVDALLNSMVQQARSPAMPDVRVYPAMPGPPPRPRAMPVMPRQTWGDVISQALAGAGDVISAGGNRPTNYLQQTMGVQQGLRNQSYQQALAQRAALEQSDRMANEYGWRTYAAGQQEKRQRFSDKLKLNEMEMYDKMLGKEKEKGERFRALLAATLPTTMGAAESVEDLDAIAAKALLETKGDPTLMAEVTRAKQLQLGKIAAAQQPGPFQKALEKLTGNYYGIYDGPTLPGYENPIMRMLQPTLPELPVQPSDVPGTSVFGSALRPKQKR